MSRLSGFPAGLLSLIGSQSFGINPKDLADTISPTMELGELYLLSKQEGKAIVFTAPVNGPNPGQGLIVPPGEVWRVHAGGFFISTGAGVQTDANLIVNLTGATIPISDSISVPASSVRMNAMKSAPFWLQSGGELGVMLASPVGVPTVSVSYIISRLRA